MKKIDAVKAVLNNIPKDNPVICATGMISRETFAAEDRETNFYMIGSMSYNSSIGIGIALNKPEKKVFILDGDGSILMNMGNLALTGYLKLDNYYHIVFNFTNCIAGNHSIDFNQTGCNTSNNQRSTRYE